MKQWTFNDTVASKIYAPWCRFGDSIVCGEKWDAGDSNNSLVMIDYEGTGTLCGSLVANNYIARAWGINGVGLFINYGDTSDNSCLMKSPDGTTAFTKLADIPDAKNSLGRSLVDLGRHTVTLDTTGGAGGSAERRILLYFARSVPGDVGGAFHDRVYVSSVATDAACGDNGNWDDLFGVDLAAVTHVHGATYVEGKGLYVYTGDTDEASSILFCAEADIPSLIDSPSTWFTRWALGSGARSAWTSDKVISDYIVAGNAQDWRIVDLPTNGSVAYFMSDSPPYQLLGGGDSQKIYKLDMGDTADSPGGTITLLKDENIKNTGFYGHYSDPALGGNGLIYVSTASYSGTSAWLEDNDGVFEIYAVDPATDEINLALRVGTDVVRYSDNSSHTLYSPFIEWNGECIAMLRPPYGDRCIDETGDVWVNITSHICGHYPHKRNIITATAIADQIVTSGYNSEQTMTFTSGSGTDSFADNDTMTGQTSGATLTLDGTVTTVSGSLAGGDLVGRFRIDALSGVFQKGETISVDGKDITFTLDGYAIWNIVTSGIPEDKYTEAIRYNSCKKAGVSGILPSGFQLKLTAGQVAEYAGQVVTVVYMVYIGEDTNTNPDMLSPYFHLQFIPGNESRTQRSDYYALKKGQWIPFIATGFCAASPTDDDIFFYPDSNSSYDNEDVEVYIADPQLYVGSLTANDIESLYPDSVTHYGNTELNKSNVKTVYP